MKRDALVMIERLPKQIAVNPDTVMIREFISRMDSIDAMMKDLLPFARPPKPKRLPTDIVPLLTATPSVS